MRRVRFTKSIKTAAVIVCGAVAILAILALAPRPLTVEVGSERVACSCPQKLVFVGGWGSTGDEGDAFYRWTRREYPSSSYRSIGFPELMNTYEVKQSSALRDIREDVLASRRSVLLVGHSMGGVFAQNIADELSGVVDEGTGRPCVGALTADAPLMHRLDKYFVPAGLRWLVRTSPLLGIGIMNDANESLTRNQPSELNWTDGVIGVGKGIHAPWNPGYLDSKDPATAALAAKEIAALKAAIGKRIDQRCKVI